MHTIDSIKRIYIDRAIAEGIIARTVQERAPKGAVIEMISDPRAVLDRFMGQGARVEKEDLLLYNYPANWVSTCPGSDGMVCCQYFVINFGLGCLFDCHYCYLQSFLNNPLMSIFGNVEDLFTELDLRTLGKKFHFRIGTGEYTDSLALENLTGYATHLIEYFARHPNATLELKTKSDHVDSLLELDHRGNTVMAWSINPPEIVEKVEPGTASLEHRLQAARKAARAGYKIAFHLDPLIHFAGWERAYHQLIEAVFDMVDPNHVAWISMGSFRYAPGLKEAIQARFPDDELTRAEMIQGPDKKYRYFKTIREEMFRSIKVKIDAINPELFLYLCMETQRLWQGVYGYVPDSAKNLDALFEKRRQFINQHATRRTVV